MRDVRFALRMIFRQPLLTAAAALVVAFGVGANTAVMSVLETVLLNPIGLRHSDRVMVARVTVDKFNMRHVQTSGVEYREIRDMKDTFQYVAAIEGRWWTSEMGGEAVRVIGRAVTPSFFDVFGELPALGRFFNPDDQFSVVLSHAFWQTAFGHDPNVLGRVLILDDKPYRIVGVAPVEFHFPVNAQVWVPLTLTPDRLARRGYNMQLDVVARLNGGVTPVRAVDRVRRYVAGLKAAPGNSDLAKLGYTIDLDPFAVYVAGDLRRPLMLLWIAAAVVLLAGCANVAGLLLTRVASRRREIAIRISLGATPGQVIRQLLIESSALGIVGGLAGLVMARLATSLLTRAALPGKALLGLVSLDARVLAYGFALAVLSGIVFGLAPAWQLMRDSQVSDLVRSRRRWFQDVFVVAQVAGAFALLVVTVVLLRSFRAVERLDPGFDASHLTTAFALKPKNDPAFLDRLESAVRSSPGIEAAALAYPIPFAGGGLTSGFNIRGRSRRPGEPEWHGEAYLISPRYFRTMRIPLLRGRALLDADSAASAPLVCVIDAKLAQRFFPDQDPVGQSIAMYAGWAQIVGIAGAIRGTTLEEGSRPVVYYPLAKVPYFPSAAVIARSALPAENAIRGAVRMTNASVAVFDIRTMEERITESLGIRRMVVLLLSLFGSISLMLAAIGLYGVIAQVVGERTQEIGIRVALGAEPGQVLWQFMRQGLQAGLAGLALGSLPVAYARRWLAGMLYEVQGVDAATIIAVGCLILVILAASVWWPAQRASRVDAWRSLRHE